MLIDIVCHLYAPCKILVDFPIVYLFGFLALIISLNRHYVTVVREFECGGIFHSRRISLAGTGLYCNIHRFAFYIHFPRDGTKPSRIEGSSGEKQLNRSLIR